jgi:hypothetical protein
MKAMKKLRNCIIVPAVLIAGLARPVRAQFLGGFFSQQSEKEKLMIAQIAGYQSCLRAIKTGYDILGTGLHTAAQLKDGTFTLHRTYFRSLSQISPVLQHDPKGKALSAAYQQIVAVFSKELTWQQQQKILSEAERTELRSIYAHLLEKCRLDLDEAAKVLTPGALQMTDTQRLAALDRLCRSMADKVAFATAFTSRCHTLALSRSQDGRDRTTLQSLYGIHQH